MDKNNPSVRFLYGTFIGRALLKLILRSHSDRPAVWFLRSGLSRIMIRPFARKHNINLGTYDSNNFRTYRDFFLRDKPGFDPDTDIDRDPKHLISPCDSWLSAFTVNEDSEFTIKGSRYSISDLLGPDGQNIVGSYKSGDCLIFRLEASDYHHYCYIDGGIVGTGHYIPGELHSVQPLACETYPVYTLNRRSWSMMETDNFGPVIQVEVGALIVGGIVNHHENRRVQRGQEKGHFDLAGSTIVLLFEKDRIRLIPEITAALEIQPEVRVEIGTKIGTKI